MLKINSQLPRALRYSVTLDGQAHSRAQPLKQPAAQRTSGRQMLVRRDPATGSLVGYFAAEQPPEAVNG